MATDPAVTVVRARRWGAVTTVALLAGLAGVAAGLTVGVWRAVHGRPGVLLVCLPAGLLALVVAGAGASRGGGAVADAAELARVPDDLADALARDLWVRYRRWLHRTPRAFGPAARLWLARGVLVLPAGARRADHLDQALLPRPLPQRPGGAAW